MSDKKPININQIPAYVRVPAGMKMRTWLHALDRAADAAQGKKPDGQFTEANFNYFKSKSLGYLRKHAQLATNLKGFKTFASFKAFLEQYRISQRCFDPEYHKAFRKCVETFGQKVCTGISGGDFSSRILSDARVYSCKVARTPLAPPIPRDRPRRRRRPPKLLAKKLPQKSVHQIFKEYLARSRQKLSVPELLAKLPPKKKAGIDPKEKQRIDKEVTGLIKKLRTSRDPQKRLSALYRLSRYASHEKVVKLADELLKMTPAQMRKEAEKMYGKVRVWLAIAFYPGLKEKVRSEMIGYVLGALKDSRNPQAIPIAMRYLGKRRDALDTIHNIYWHFKRKGQLSKIKDPDPTPLMLELQRTRYSEDRRTIVFILENMQDPKTKNQRITALRLILDRWTSYRDPAGALDALVRIGDPVALPDIMRLVKNTKKEIDIRASALMAMGAFKHPASKAKRVAFIMPYLKHTNPKMVEAAITALGYARELSVVPKLIAILRDKSQKKYHYAAIRALGFIRDSRAVSVLRTFLDKKLWDEALWALGEIGGRAAHQVIVGQMIESYKSYTFFRRIAVDVNMVKYGIKALKKHRKDAISTLNAAYLVKRGDTKAQELIIYALGKLGARDVLETLTGTAVAKTADKNRHVQEKVVRALSRAHTDKTLLKLTHVLLKGKKREQRIRAALVLRDIGSRRVAPALTKAANHRVVKDVAIRKAALIALCEVNSKWARSRLHDVLATDPAISMRLIAAKQLGGSKDAKTVKILIAAAQKTSEDMNVRLAATISLGKTVGRKALPVLKSFTKNKDNRIRRSAIVALSEFEKRMSFRELHRLRRLCRSTSQTSSIRKRRELWCTPRWGLTGAPVRHARGGRSQAGVWAGSDSSGSRAARHRGSRR